MATNTTDKIDPVVSATPVASPTAEQDATTAPKPKTTFFTKIGAFFGDWYYLWEVLGIVISAGAILGICIVVWHFDDKPPPVWEHKVPFREQNFQLTINSLLSILSVFGSTCAMIPVTKGLGQLKYVWFMEQDRKLADLEMFDSASRGKLGSAQLIWKLRFKHLAVLGGLASLLALAYGPFVQNLIVITLDYRLSNEVSQISFADQYAFDPVTGIVGASSTMKYTIGSAIVDASNDWIVPPNNCPTGECDWYGYVTLAACTRCTDISDRLTRTCTPFKDATANSSASGGCEVSLPNGLSLTNVPEALNRDGWSPARNVFVMNTTLDPLVYDYKNHFATVQFIMGFDPDQMPTNSTDGPEPLKPYMITEDSPLVARECAIIPCVQKQSFFLQREASGVRVIPDVQILKEWTNYTQRDTGGSDLIEVEIDFSETDANMTTQQSQQWLAPPYFGGEAYKSLRDWLRDYLTAYTFTYIDPSTGNWTFGTEATLISGTPPHTSILNNSATDSWGSPYCVTGDTVRPDVECAMHNLAAGLTNGLRTDMWEVLPESRRVAEGQSFAPVQICHAQWQYISAPLAVWVLGLVLFGGVVWKTRRANIKAWRTSPLATLLLRLDPDSREQLKGWQHMGDAELRSTAEALRLRLRVDEEGPPRFVRRGEEEGRAGEV